MTNFKIHARGFQLLLIGLFILVFLIGLATSLVSTLGLNPGQFKISLRLSLGLTSLINLVLVAGLVVTLNYLLNADAEGFGPTVPFSVPLSILSLCSAALGLAMLFFTVRVYQMRARPVAARAVLAFFGLVAAGFIPFLWYWGLLGFPL